MGSGRGCRLGLEKLSARVKPNFHGPYRGRKMGSSPESLGPDTRYCRSHQPGDDDSEKGFGFHWLLLSESWRGVSGLPSVRFSLARIPDQIMDGISLFYLAVLMGVGIRQAVFQAFGGGGH